MTGLPGRRYVDSGVIVAGFAPWHEHHAQARDVLNGDVAVAAHALVESYSVLTRLPAPFRAPAGVVVSFLQQRFSGQSIQLTPESVVGVLALCAQQGLTGGAVYDALIAATVREVDGILVTLDQRAVRTYRAIGCAVDFLGGPLER